MHSRGRLLASSSIAVAGTAIMDQPPSTILSSGGSLANLKHALIELAHTIALTCFNFTLLLAELTLLTVYRSLSGALNLCHRSVQYFIIAPVQFFWKTFLTIYEKFIIPIFYFSLFASVMGMVAGIVVGLYAVFVQSLIPAATASAEPRLLIDDDEKSTGKAHSTSFRGKPPSPIIHGNTITVRRKNTGGSETMQSRWVVSTGGSTSTVTEASRGSLTTSPIRKRTSISGSASPLHSSSMEDFGSYIGEASDGQHASLYEDDDGYSPQLINNLIGSIGNSYSTISRRSSRVSLRSSTAPAKNFLVPGEENDDSLSRRSSRASSIDDDYNMHRAMNASTRNRVYHHRDSPRKTNRSSTTITTVDSNPSGSLDLSPSNSSENSVRFIESKLGDTETHSESSAEENIVCRRPVAAGYGDESLFGPRNW